MINLNPVSWINRLFSNKKFLVSFSVICAIVFWLVIDITQNPSRDITFSDVPISIKEQIDYNDRSLEPYGDYIESVSVTVNGPGYIVSTVDKEDIKISVKSYAEVSSPGSYKLVLSASVSKNDCEVVSVTPSVISVDYDYFVTVDIPVEVNVSEIAHIVDNRYNQKDEQGNVIKDGVGGFLGVDTQKSKLHSSDNKEILTISVRGPESLVSKVTKAEIKPVFNADKFELSGFQRYNDYEISFCDESGSSVDSKSFDYSVEEDSYVRINIFRQAEVNIKPTFTNIPEYYITNNKKLSYSLYRYNELVKNENKYDLISSIMVKGPMETVDRLLVEGISLSAIDFKDIKGNTENFKCTFVLENGVEIFDGTEEIIVVVHDVKKELSTKVVSVDPSQIQLINIGDKNIEVVHANAIKVTLVGKSADLKKIKAEHLALVVDCGGTEGLKSVSVKIDGKYLAWPIEVKTSNDGKVNVSEK